jgi:hypothetical protein
MITRRGKAVAWIVSPVRPKPPTWPARRRTPSAPRAGASPSAAPGLKTSSKKAGDRAVLDHRNPLTSRDFVPWRFFGRQLAERAVCLFVANLHIPVSKPRRHGNLRHSS